MWAFWKKEKKMRIAKIIFCLVVVFSIRYAKGASPLVFQNDECHAWGSYSYYYWDANDNQYSFSDDYNSASGGSVSYSDSVYSSSGAGRLWVYASSGADCYGASAGGYAEGDWTFRPQVAGYSLKIEFDCSNMWFGDSMDVYLEDVTNGNQIFGYGGSAYYLWGEVENPPNEAFYFTTDLLDPTHLYHMHASVGSTADEDGPWSGSINVTVVPGPDSLDVIELKQPWPGDDGIFTNPEGINSIKLLWKTPVLFEPNFISITDENGNLIDFSVSQNNSGVMNIIFNKTLLNDKYTIEISDSVTDSNSGLQIDGDMDGVIGGNALITLEHRKRIDINNDNQINFADFAEFAENWLWSFDYDDGVVGYWDFESVVGSIISDSSRYSNDAQLCGGTIVNNGEASFDGIDDFAEIPNSNSLLFENQITLSAWVYVQEYKNDWPKILVKPYTTFSDPWELFCLDLNQHGNNPRFVITDGTPGGQIKVVSNAAVNLEINRWYHVLGAYDGQTASLYLDGELIASKQAAIQFNNIAMPLSIGSRLGQNLFKGKIDEVRIYNRAVTLPEIELLSQSR